MVGRTPEFMGHKVEAKEVKIAALVTLVCAFLIKEEPLWLHIFLCITPTPTGQQNLPAGSTIPAIMVFRNALSVHVFHSK
jgi:hypothetical protein